MRTESSLRTPTNPPEIPEPDLYITEARAAEILSVNPRTLQQWRLRGGGPKYVRISTRCVRYRVGDLTRWMDERLRSSTSEA